MAGGETTLVLPPRGRWQREALTVGGVQTKAAAAAARCRVRFSFAPFHHFVVPLPQWGRIA